MTSSAMPSPTMKPGSKHPSAARSAAVFLDRDGVINHAPVRDGKPCSPENVEALKILPGVPEALARLKNAGFLLIVITNQPNVARGIQTRASIEAIHAHLMATMPLDDVRVCYHDDADRCACRKPAPGMILDAAREWEIDLASSFMVGDRWRDIEAGLRAGCRTVFVNHRYRETQPDRFDLQVASLMEAVPWLCGLCGKTPSAR